MKNPIEKAYLLGAGMAAIYVLVVLGVLTIWATCVMFGWNGFAVPEFHVPPLDFWRAFWGIVLLNFIIAPLYGLVQTKK